MMRPSRSCLLVVPLLLGGCPQSHVGRFDCEGDPCDDHDPCNGTEVCDATRGCVAATPVDCDDRDPCTTDLCGAGGCTHAPRDLDRDGHPDRCAGGDDCAPQDAAVFPGATEVCNGVDDDCDLEIDEGLDLVLLEERDLTFGADAILSDGTVLGVWDSLHVDREGQTNSLVLSDQVDGYSRLAWPLNAALVDGGGAWLAHNWGPARVDPFGNPWRGSERIVVHHFDGSEVSPVPLVREIVPRGNDHRRPASFAAEWIGAAPFLAWVDVSSTEEILLTRLDEPQGSVSQVIQAPEGIDAVALAADPTGATVFWVGHVGHENALLATRVDAQGEPSAAAAEVARGSLTDLVACSTPDGAVVAARRNEPEAIDLALWWVDRSLVVTAVTILDADPVSGVLDLQCFGRTVLVLDAVPSPTNPFVRDGFTRLRRLGADREVDFEETIDFPLIGFLEGSSIAIVGDTRRNATEPQFALATYGCEP